MNKWVSVSDKREFLRWFLNHHRLKHPEARKIIEYILKRYHMLEHVTFTNQINLNKKTIVISSMNSDEAGFTFYNKKHKTSDISIALGELMTHPFDSVNLILHFHGKMSNYRYTQLLQNPVKDQVKPYKQFQKYSKEADAVIKQVMIRKDIEDTRDKIDEALDQKDKDSFSRLVEKLKELEIERDKLILKSGRNS